jgi:hypothetical protein
MISNNFFFPASGSPLSTRVFSVCLTMILLFLFVKSSPKHELGSLRLRWNELEDGTVGTPTADLREGEGEMSRWGL